MKPVGARELPIHAALMAHTLVQATEILGRGKRYFLKVASQNLEHAAMLCALGTFGDVGIQLDCSYTPDEWTLTSWEWVDNKCRTESVWSPGA
jgi:hypothetical protein